METSVFILADSYAKRKHFLSRKEEENGFSEDTVIWIARWREIMGEFDTVKSQGLGSMFHNDMEEFFNKKLWDDDFCYTTRPIDDVGATFLTMFQALMNIDDEEKKGIDLHLVVNTVGGVVLGTTLGLKKVDPFYTNYALRLKGELEKFKTVQITTNEMDRGFFKEEEEEYYDVENW
jgi:hypothetical protein